MLSWLFLRSGETQTSTSSVIVGRDSGRWGGDELSQVHFARTRLTRAPRSRSENARCFIFDLLSQQPGTSSHPTANPQDPPPPPPHPSFSFLFLIPAANTNANHTTKVWPTPPSTSLMPTVCSLESSLFASPFALSLLQKEKKKNTENNVFAEIRRNKNTWPATGWLQSLPRSKI